MEPNKDSVYSVLGGVEDPAKRNDVVSLGYVTSVETGPGSLEVVLTLPSPPTPLKKDLRSDCRKALIEAFPDLDDVDVFLEYTAADSASQSQEKSAGAAKKGSEQASAGANTEQSGGARRGPAG
ncbi:MAG: iron-sulfur cluster assembly protein, partial [Spirochaetia bacterium]